MKEEEKARQQLQGLIKEMGLKDELKTQLRVKIAQKLANSQAVAQHSQPNDQLSNRIIASLINQYFNKLGHTFSASIFGAESGYDEKMLERGELLELLGIQVPHKELAILQYIVEKSPGRGSLMRNAQIQTEEQEGTISLEQKFAVMDLQFRRVLEEHRSHNVISGGHKCNEQKIWYEKQLAKFRQFEAHKIKIKVGEEWRKKFQAYAEDMENDLRRKIDRLRHRQKALIEQAAAKQKLFEEKLKGWQASAKSRLQLIDMKEITINRERMNLEVQRKKIIDEGKKTNQEAKGKCREYDKLLLSLQNRIDYEVGLAKLSMEQAQSQREEQYANKRRFIDEEYGKLMGIKDSMDILKRQNQRVIKQNEILREQCKRLREELRSAFGEASSKGDRIDHLRQELTDVKNDKKDLEIKVAEQARLRKKRQTEVSEARKELQTLRAKQKAEQSESEQEVPRRFNNDIGLKVVSLRDQRRKDIQKLKLQL